MSLRTALTILAVILLVGHTVSAPGGKPGSRLRGKPPVRRPAVNKGGTKGGTEGGTGGGEKGGSSPAVQPTAVNNRRSNLPIDILPYHYIVSIVPDLDNSTFFGEVIIDFEAERATQEIVLHAANLQIDYDKLVLTERRCTPPSLEATSTPAPPPTPDYVLTARPSPASFTTSTPAPEAAISSEQSTSVSDKVTSAAPPTEEAPAIAEAPAMASEVPPMEPSPAPAMEEAPAPPIEESPAPPMEESPAPPMEEAPAPAPPMEEAPTLPMEEAPIISEEAPAMQEQSLTQEATASPMEEAPKQPMEEAPMQPMEEAPMQPMEEASVQPMEEAPAEKVPEEGPMESEKTSMPAMQEPMPEVSATHQEAPVMMDEAPSMAEEISHDEAQPMEEDLPVTYEAPVVANEKAEINANSASEGSMPQEATTVKEQPAETTTEKDTFNLAGEALKILEVLNRSDIPPFIKANLTDDDDMANLSDDGIEEQAIDKIDYIDKVETRTDDLMIEDCQKIEVVVPPPANFVKPRPEEEESMEETTAGVFNSIRNAIEQIVQTTLAPLLKEDQSAVEEKIPENILEEDMTTVKIQADNPEDLRTIAGKPSGENALHGNSDIEMTTDGKSEDEIATEGKSEVEITTDGKSEIKIINSEKSEAGIVSDGKTEAEIVSDGKIEAEIVSDGKTEAEIVSDGKADAGITTDKKSEVEITTEGKYAEAELTIDGKYAEPVITTGADVTTDGKSLVEITTDGKPATGITSGKSEIENREDKISNTEITTDRSPDTESTTDDKSELVSTTEGKFVESTTIRRSDATTTNFAKSEVEMTTDRRTDIASTTEEKADIDSTTGRMEIADMEPLQREEAADLPASTATVPEKTTFIPTTEKVTALIREITDSTDPPVSLGTEWSIDLSESVTTEDIAYAHSTTERTPEGTTEHLTTTTATKKSRKRRAAPKRKRRPPSNRFKLKQSLRLPTCTTEDMYEVRVDKALSPVKRRTETESSDLGIELAKDKIRQEDHDALVLPTKTALQAGKRYRLTMSFSGKMSRRPVGLYRSDYVVEEGGRKKPKSVATTVFEPIHARRVFPCIDDPRYRARFSMRIAHPPNLSAYSNMPASTTSDDVDSTSSSGIPSGWLWDRFDTSPPMPTYLVAFFVGALARKSRTAAGEPGQNNLMVRVLARRERLRDASFALSLAPKVMMEMGQWLNKPTSLTKLDLLALPGPGPDAVENWGLVSFQERYLLTQPGLLSRLSVASVVSHELAHDWFGNLVTPHHWKYAWLSEGLATYTSAKILNKIQPTWDAEDLATVSAYIAAMASDDEDAIPMQPKKITSNNYRAVFSPASYYKGYMTMRMLNGIIGDEMLTESLRRYVQQNAFGWAKTSRLWAAVNETAMEKSKNLDFPRSLSKLMSSWIEAPGYPLVTITRNYSSGEVFVQQTRHSASRSESESNTTWWIPLRTWTAKTTGAHLQWLPPSSKRKAVRLSSTLPIGGDQWLMANAEFSAPMRVQYDLKNWDLLAAALPNGNLPRGAGAQLSVDALSLASNGQLPFSTALKVVAAALGSRTGDAHLTWTAASPALRRMDRELRGTKASRPYRQWLHRLITPLDTWISFDARNDTVPDAVLARHVTTAACSLAMPLCLTTGRSQFRTWMASNTPEPRVPIELRGALYCAAVRDGNSDTIWRYLWSKMATVSSDEKMRILKALGCTRDPELAKRLLALAADVKSPVYKKQLPTLMRSIAMHDSGPGIVLSFLAENMQKFGNDTKTLAKLISEVAPAVNSKKDMKKLQGLLPQITTSRATVVKVSADATAAVERSQRLSQGIFAYFNKSKRT